MSSKSSRVMVAIIIIIIIIEMKQTREFNCMEQRPPRLMFNIGRPDVVVSRNVLIPSELQSTTRHHQVDVSTHNTNVGSRHSCYRLYFQCSEDL